MKIHKSFPLESFGNGHPLFFQHYDSVVGLLLKPLDNLACDIWLILNFFVPIDEFHLVYLLEAVRADFQNSGEADDCVFIAGIWVFQTVDESKYLIRSTLLQIYC